MAVVITIMIMISCIMVCVIVVQMFISRFISTSSISNNIIYVCTPDLPTNITPTNIARLELFRKSPMDMRIPPL